LLSRPRYTPYDESAGLAGEGSADNETDDDSDGSYDPMEVDEDFKSQPWLDGCCPEPPMPRDNLPHSSLLVEPDCIYSRY
jgi:hypothetical protein